MGQMCSKSAEASSGVFSHGHCWVDACDPSRLRPPTSQIVALGGKHQSRLDSLQGVCIRSSRGGV